MTGDVIHRQIYVLVGSEFTLNNLARILPALGIHLTRRDNGPVRIFVCEA